MSILRKSVATLALTLSVAAIATTAQATPVVTFGNYLPISGQPFMGFSASQQGIPSFPPFTVPHPQGGSSAGLLHFSFSGSTFTDPAKVVDVAAGIGPVDGKVAFYAWLDNLNPVTSLGGGIYKVNFIDGYLRIDQDVPFVDTYAEGYFSSGYITTDVNGYAVKFNVDGTASWTSSTGSTLDPGFGWENFQYDIGGASAKIVVGGAYNSTNWIAGANNGSLTSAPVPEPGEWAAMGILASGLTGLMIKARRRK